MKYILILFTLYVLPAQAADANLIIAILECESSGRHHDKTDPTKMNCGDSGASCGIAQFKQETFYRFAREAGYKNFYYKNAIHQLKLMNWAIDNGKGRHWTCYTKLNNPMDSKN